MGHWKNFRSRHPLVADALVWSLPALGFGLVLRLLLISHSPYAYWGSDSRSFMGFASGVLNEFYFSLGEKRRYLYPLLMLPVSILPGGTLRWVAILQPLLGLASVVGFAYLVRKCFRAWKLWILPLTFLLAGLPVFVWYEHELLADSLFFNALIWTFAGWVAWAGPGVNPARARRLFWLFLAALAVFVLTKPSAKFLWPGLAVGLAVSGGWRLLRWPQMGGLAALFLVGLTVGDRDQGAWLLYTRAFPWTVLESPAHQELKQEVAVLVRETRADLVAYADNDDRVHDFLRSPENHPEFPRWHELGKDEEAHSTVMLELAKEAILSHPIGFSWLGYLRMAGSARLEAFKLERFDGDYSGRRLLEASTREKNPEPMMRVALGIPKSQPFPSWEDIARQVSPWPDAAAARWLRAYCEAYGRLGNLFDRSVDDVPWQPTGLGWWVAAAAVLTASGVWRKTLLPIALMSASYLAGVYLVGGEHTRYFAPVWPAVILLLPVPLELAAGLLKKPRPRCARGG